MAKKTKKREFRTPYSESVLVGTLETFMGASLTEPDNSMTIPEIIAKYTRGQGIHVRQNPWTVGEATEDGYTVGDGVDPEGFMNFGASLADFPGSSEAGTGSGAGGASAPGSAGSPGAQEPQESQDPPALQESVSTN